jgi:hypothetical protein
VAQVLVLVAALCAPLLRPLEPAAAAPAQAPSTACGIMFGGTRAAGDPSEDTFLRGPAAGQDGARAGYCWALIGSDRSHLAEEYAAGVRAKLFSLNWREYMPAEGVVDPNYVTRKRTELTELRQAGFAVILSLGYHDAPGWLHANYPNSRYINQYGVAYSGNGLMDSGDANLVFNPALRALVAGYMRRVFADLGTDFVAVRLGGGRYGELTYPPAIYAGLGNSYWAFDANALAQSPVPAWRPGQPSPNGEARAFVNWYHGALVNYQNWQISTLRASYDGPITMLYPSWGIRPTQIDAAVAVNLNGSTSAELNGEIQRGYDFARQVAAIGDPEVIVTTTWLDADASRDGGNDSRYWSPVKYLATLAARHPLRLAVFGENTGHGSRAVMELSAAQAERYGLLGMAWYREEELYSGQYASLGDYRQVIARTAFRAYTPLLSQR